jgi:hypothetical protein
MRRHGGKAGWRSDGPISSSCAHRRAIPTTIRAAPALSGLSAGLAPVTWSTAQFPARAVAQSSGDPIAAPRPARAAGWPPGRRMIVAMSVLSARTIGCGVFAGAGARQPITRNPARRIRRLSAGPAARARDASPPESFQLPFFRPAHQQHVVDHNLTRPDSRSGGITPRPRAVHNVVPFAPLPVQSGAGETSRPE